jgi:hypothetical protein
MPLGREERNAQPVLMGATILLLPDIGKWLWTSG